MAERKREGKRRKGKKNSKGQEKRIYEKVKDQQEKIIVKTEKSKADNKKGTSDK